MAARFGLGAPSVVAGTLTIRDTASLQIGDRTCPGGSWLGVGVIVVVAAALWWPKWQVNLLRLKIRDPKARADVEDNFRRTIGQLLGGAAVLIGTGFAYYQSQLTIIGQQVSKGFEQLGSDKIGVRLGGIYALEGVMNTSEQYPQTVLEGLCAFVRDGTKTDMGQRPPATDIQAALTVIGRREAGTGVVDLNGSHVSKAKLSLANLREANLSGADLSFAALFLADLRGADLRCRPELRPSRDHERDPEPAGQGMQR